MNIESYTIIRKAVRKFIDDDCITLATSISFVFLLSLVPLSLLMVYIISMLQAWFFPIHDGWGQLVKEIYTKEMSQMIPFISREWLIKYVIEAQADLSFKVINLILLSIISGLLFKTLEVSFRKIFGLPTRHVLIGQLLYAVGSIFLIVSIFLVNFIWGILNPIANHYAQVISVKNSCGLNMSLSVQQKRIKETVRKFHLSPLRAGIVQDFKEPVRSDPQVKFSTGSNYVMFSE